MSSVIFHPDMSSEIIGKFSQKDLEKYLDHVHGTCAYTYELCDVNHLLVSEGIFEEFYKEYRGYEYVINVSLSDTWLAKSEFDFQEEQWSGSALVKATETGDTRMQKAILRCR